MTWRGQARRFSHATSSYIPTLCSYDTVFTDYFVSFPSLQPSPYTIMTAHMKNSSPYISSMSARPSKARSDITSMLTCGIYLHLAFGAGSSPQRRRVLQPACCCSSAQLRRPIDQHITQTVLSRCPSVLTCYRQHQYHPR